MGLLDQAKQWMTPERAIGLQGLGMGLSQMSMGQPVDLSPAYAALDARQKSQQMRKVMDTPGLLDQFTPQQRAILAQMPEELAVQLITQQAFAPAPEPAGPQSTLGKLQADYNAGLIPKDVYDREVAAIGSPQNVVNVGPTGIDYGQPPTDMAWARNQDGSVKLDERGAPVAVTITGSPGDMKRVQDVTKMAGDAIANADKTGATQGSKDTSTDVIVSAADRARQAADERMVGGAAGALAAINPASMNAEVYRQIEVLRSNAKIEALNQMRAQSPTGGALGNVTEGEGQMLAAKAGALDPASPNFQRDLDDYERTLLRVIHGPAEGDRIFEQTRKKSGDVIDGYTIEEVQ